LAPTVAQTQPLIRETDGRLAQEKSTPKPLSKLLIAAVAIAGLGVGGWFVYRQRSASTEKQEVAAVQATAARPNSRGPGSTTPEPPTEPLPVSPTEAAPESLWIVPPTGSILSCEAAVPNLAELKAGGEQQANLSWAKARQSLVLGDLDKALVSLCEAVLLQTDSLALEGLASVYVSKRAPDMAKKWHDLALAARPDRGKTIEVGGDIQSLLGNVTGARDAFAKALGLDPHDQRTLNIIAANNIADAEKQRRAGALTQAELLFRRAASLNPDSTDAAAGMATTFAALGDTKMAQRWAEHTLKLDSGHHIALVVLAAIATEAGDKDRAKALCNQAIERNPNYLPAHQLLKSLASN
jgi:tetratricopeptide (TPR) repeat protein